MTPQIASMFLGFTDPKRKTKPLARRCPQCTAKDPVSPEAVNRR